MKNHQAVILPVTVHNHFQHQPRQGQRRDQRRRVPGAGRRPVTGGKGGAKGKRSAARLFGVGPENYGRSAIPFIYWLPPITRFALCLSSSSALHFSMGLRIALSNASVTFISFTSYYPFNFQTAWNHKKKKAASHFRQAAFSSPFMDDTEQTIYKNVSRRVRI